MRRFSRRISGDSLASAAPLRKASIPPFFSIVRIAVVLRRSRTAPSVSDNSEMRCRLGRKRRFVLMLEWLTLWPTWTPLPVTGHLRAMRHLVSATAIINGAAVSGPPEGRGQARRKLLSREPPIDYYRMRREAARWLIWRLRARGS